MVILSSNSNNSKNNCLMVGNQSTRQLCLLRRATDTLPRIGDVGGCQHDDYGTFYLGYPKRDHNFDNHPHAKASDLPEPCTRSFSNSAPGGKSGQTTRPS